MGNVGKVKEERPQVMATLLPSAAKTTGWAGKERAMSANNRPDTNALPAASTSASISTRVETS